MAEQPSLHIDSDWKKQAQEEKRRLAEEEQKKTAAAPPSAPLASTPAGAAPARVPRGRGQRELPPAGIPTLVSQLLTQTLMYLGEVAAMGGEPILNFDMARHQVDTLAVLDEKTRGNLSEDEQKVLDTALYEAQTRFIAVASQYL
jgi:hypothetical protein